MTFDFFIYFYLITVKVLLEALLWYNYARTPKLSNICKKEKCVKRTGFIIVRIKFEIMDQTSAVKVII